MRSCLEVLQVEIGISARTIISPNCLESCALFLCKCCVCCRILNLWDIRKTRAVWIAGFFYSSQLMLKSCLDLKNVIVLSGKWRTSQMISVKVSETSNIAASNLVNRLYLMSKVYIFQYIPCNSM